MPENNQLYLYAIHILPTKPGTPAMMKVVHDGPCPVRTELRLAGDPPEGVETDWIGHLWLWVESVGAGSASCTVESVLDQLYPVDMDIVLCDRPCEFVPEDWMSPWQAVVLWACDHPVDPLQYYRDHLAGGKQLEKPMEPGRQISSPGTHKWQRERKEEQTQTGVPRPPVPKAFPMSPAPRKPEQKENKWGQHMAGGKQEKSEHAENKPYVQAVKTTADPIQDRIACFQNTMELAWKGELAARTQNAVQASRVYREGFRCEGLRKLRHLEEVRIVEGTSFDTAKALAGDFKVAVLNFANPHYPGGGVAKGAMAQEECLCRSSNLFACLSAPQVHGDYYAYHRERTDYFFSDRLIYSPGITVFKTDDRLPVLMREEEWFRVDVITCAAPFLAQRKYTNRAALKQTFKSRIRNIFEAAMDNGVEVLVLGAFGCGAFKNPPEVVAAAFHEVLQEQRYRTAFSHVVFAIKRTVDESDVCPNLSAFEMEFFGISSEMAKLRFMDPIGGWTNPDTALPGGRVLKSGNESNAFHEWRRKNPYFGKQFSVLGDSISTLEGFNPRGYNVFYQGKTCEQAGVREMKDTWWGKIIDFFGGELLVNNAWSGSRAAARRSDEDPFPAGCSPRRTGGLHIGNVKPDVILVYIGINDWANGGPVNDGSSAAVLSNIKFDIAYGDMVRQLRENYPGAEIWCCTLSETCMASDPGFRFPSAYGGIELQEINQIIRESAERNECRCLDIYSIREPYDSLDGTHPTASGMDTLAWTMLAAMKDEEILKWLGKEVSQVTGPLPRFGQSLGAPLRLMMKEDKKERILNGPGPCFMAGRGPDCHLRLTSPYVARNQAIFIREGNSWFLRDNDSKNGTLVNGIRLKSGEIVMLKPGDRISFARREEAVVME